MYYLDSVVQHTQTNIAFRSSKLSWGGKAIVYKILSFIILFFITVSKTVRVCFKTFNKPMLAHTCALKIFM